MFKMNRSVGAQKHLSTESARNSLSNWKSAAFLRVIYEDIEQLYLGTEL